MRWVWSIGYSFVPMKADPDWNFYGLKDCGSPMHIWSLGGLPNAVENSAKATFDRLRWLCPGFSDIDRPEMIERIRNVNLYPCELGHLVLAGHSKPGTVNYQPAISIDVEPLGS